ncbi:coproporphyrinogen-III oxidase family protein [Acetobacteraceae bacterium ESL0709]|nr:coproporphyrinogen-III oxidase family protein [Acetobacteraceae bacterium ESL0697]MDF7679082.1 coproporphyrinogen-III oxidase family protein [Acetobacteraceae bacterium ESL0709]
MSFIKRDVESEIRPYPNKCHLPFILYPPSMHKVDDGHQFVVQNGGLDEKGKDFVLYLSVPFCRVRCKACPYFIDILSREDRKGKEDIYVDALLKDIEHWASYRRWKTGCVRAIYLGGGTGSILKTSNLKRVVDTVFNSFHVADDYCFTLEGNAKDFDDEKIEYVASSRINRVSLGVQSFQPEVLRVVGSPHAAEQSIEVIHKFQARGFNDIQLDLMFNMPEHTIEVWRRDLQKIVDLDIPHFTVYLYRLHEGTPQDRLIREGKVSPMHHPENLVVKSMIKEVSDLAKAFGFNMYMVDHFAKPGFENKYNHWSWKIYTDALAIGPGAYSYFGGYRFGTNKDIDGYITDVNAGRFRINTVTERMTLQIEKERYVIFTLLYYVVDRSAYQEKFSSDFVDDFKEIVAHLVDRGLASVDETEFRLTSFGIEWHSNVLLEFFNSVFWGDEEALQEPNWAMNVPMVELSAHKREYWLGK